jgi:molybdate transport system regulatory protein
MTRIRQSKAAPLLAARVSFRLLLGETRLFGPGKAQLLDAIEKSGSISGAARALGMSYRRAWLLVDALNRDFSEPLVETAMGGAAGGGARITPFGQAVRIRHRTIASKMEAAVRSDLEAFGRLAAAAD